MYIIRIDVLIIKLYICLLLEYRPDKWIDRFIFTCRLLKLQITIEATIVNRGNFDQFLSDWMIVDIDNLVDGDKFWLNNNNNVTTVTS